MFRIITAVVIVGLLAVLAVGLNSQISAPAGSGATESSTDGTDDSVPGVRFRMPGAEGGALSTPTAPTPSTPGNQVVDSATRGGADGAAGASEKPEFSPAEIVEFYPPFYPLPLRLEGIEGRIDLDVAIGLDGSVTSVDVSAATAPEFREYAVEAAKEWTFLPAKINGNPVPVRVKFPIPFISEFGSGDLYANSPLARLRYLDGRYYWIGDDGKMSPANMSVTPLLRPSPVYARSGEDPGQLRVELSFTVNEVGRVVSPSVTESSETSFDQAALRAIRYWQFIPQIKSGRPVASRVKLPIVFGEAKS